MGEFAMRSLKLKKWHYGHTIKLPNRRIEAVADVRLGMTPTAHPHYQVNEDEDNVTLQLNAEVKDNVILRRLPMKTSWATREV
ncbi:hypothetical protein O9992_01065 [Vibrio lentus]|nr:hypothetical protein [Vibrio lentus]